MARVARSKSNGNDERIRIEYVSIDEIKRWPKNPKRHDLDAIGASIDRFGYVQPLLRDEKTGQLAAGHGRLDRLAKMKADGSPPPKRIVVEGTSWLVPVICGVSFANAKEAHAYVLADNRSSELGGYDDELLKAALTDLDGLLAGTGWVDADLEALFESSHDANSLEPRVSHDFSIDLTCRCPKCGHEWSEPKRQSKRRAAESA